MGRITLSGQVRAHFFREGLLDFSSFLTPYQLKLLASLITDENEDLFLTSEKARIFLTKGLFGQIVTALFPTQTLQLVHDSWSKTAQKIEPDSLHSALAVVCCFDQTQETCQAMVRPETALTPHAFAGYALYPASYERTTRTHHFIHRYSVGEPLKKYTHPTLP